MRTNSLAIECRDFAVGYGDAPVLEGLSFTVERGDTVAVVGRSGCGKTTILRTLAGILHPLQGEATVLGSRLPTMPPPGTVGYIPQSLGLVMHATVRRNVLHGTLTDLTTIRSLLGRFPADAISAADAAIEAVGLAGRENSRVSTLSGGQRRRVAIARALVQSPRLLLADEILSELDGETAAEIITCIRQLQSADEMTVVLVEHDLELANELADHLLQIGPDVTRTVRSSHVMAHD